MYAIKCIAPWIDHCCRSLHCESDQNNWPLMQDRDKILFVDLSVPYKRPTRPYFSRHRGGYLEKLAQLKPGDEPITYFHPTTAKQTIREFIHQQRCRLGKDLRQVAYPEK